MREPAGVAELRELIDSYGDLTDAALQACLRRDSETFSALIDARDVLTSRIGEVTRELDDRRARGTPLTRLTPVQSGLARIGELDRELLGAATKWRDETGRELRQLGRDERALAAYSAPAATGDRAIIDFTR